MCKFPGRCIFLRRTRMPWNKRLPKDSPAPLGFFPMARFRAYILRRVGIGMYLLESICWLRDPKHHWSSGGYQV